MAASLSLRSPTPGLAFYVWISAGVGWIGPYAVVDDDWMRVRFDSADGLDRKGRRMPRSQWFNLQKQGRLSFAKPTSERPLTVNSL